MIENLLMWAIQALILLLFVRSLLTWIPNLDYRNPLVKLIVDVTEPILSPIRRTVGIQNGMDFSPIIAFLALYVLSIMIQRIL